MNARFAGKLPQGGKDGLYLALRPVAARQEQSPEAGVALPAGPESRPAPASCLLDRRCPYPRPVVVVTVAWVVPVTVRHTRVPGIVVPRTAAQRFGFVPIPRVTGQNPSHFKGASLPVETVNWNEAKSYCEAIGGRLPTEAEWEYATRAGSTAARYGNLDEIAWYSENSGNQTHEVGQKRANAFGLYDMLGNMWQWVAAQPGPWPIPPNRCKRSSRFTISHGICHHEWHDTPNRSFGPYRSPKAAPGPFWAAGRRGPRNRRK